MNVQALVVGATGFVTGGEAHAGAGYTPVLPIQPATSGTVVIFYFGLSLSPRFCGRQDITGCNYLI